jgi:hypothetical protein
MYAALEKSDAGSGGLYFGNSELVDFYHETWYRDAYEIGEQ